MFTFKVTPDDGEEYEVPVGTRDVVVWEKLGPGRSLSGLLRDLKAADMYAIAHIAARRQQLFTGTLDEFEKTCEIDSKSMFEVEAEPDPTQPDPLAALLSPSPSTPASPPSGGKPKRNG